MTDMAREIQASQYFCCIDRLAVLLTVVGTSVLVLQTKILIFFLQDKDDDAVLGLKSTSLYFGDKTKPWLSVFLLAMTSNLVVSGIQSEQTWPYHVAAMSCATLLGKQVRWT